jgi:hypothetical protein
VKVRGCFRSSFFPCTFLRADLAMNRSPLNHILESSLCANPKYELVLFDRLPPGQREMLKDLKKDPSFYGLLCPVDHSGLGVKSVSRDIALLFLTLQRPGKLPDYVRSMLGEGCNQEITRLVLDGVLAIEREGKLLSGSEAAELIYAGNEGSSVLTAAEGFLERLSLEALRYGQALGLTDRIALSSRLYNYNRMPLSPFWKRTLPDAGAIDVYLGIRDGRNRELLDREWSKISDPALSEGWLAWQSRRFGSSTSFGKPTKIGCKLYISPRTDRLPEFLPTILTVLSGCPVRHFKIGKGAQGLLRPDKMVAYFSSYEELIATAEQLKKDLGGCPAQGVPFTAELGGDGLLSWGVDPPAEGQVLPWLGRESWRLWVTNRLAVALIATSMENTANLEPWQFALRRLQLEGVDTRSWTPALTDWKRSFRAEN